VFILADTLQKLGRYAIIIGGDMNLVVAIIKPFKLDEVREALTGLGIEGLTVTEVKGFGRQKGKTEIYRGAEYTVEFLPKIKIEVAVAADMTEKVLEGIRGAANTDQIGDGKIFVLDLGQAVRIRTGESGTEAL
jgi:nitrogen regulatory protein P-II 2|tara:strand:- start:1439 stop:1840 length:402 start_codon:yes stop_codon:yes gene_type:complete